MGNRSVVLLTKFLKDQLHAAQLPDINRIFPEGQYLFGLDDFDHNDPSLIAMRHAYRAWLDSAQFPPVKKGNELRPILADVGRPGVRSLSVRSLLVGESIAYLHCDTHEGFKIFWERVKELEDLIDRGLVFLLPETIIYGRGVEAARKWMGIPPERMMWQAGFYAIAFEAGRTATDVMEIMQCVQSLELSSRFPNIFDLVSPDKRHTEAYRFLLESSVDQYRSEVTTHDRLSFFPKVLSLPLPNLNLSLTDMVNVRDDGIFDEWRSAFCTSLTTLRDPSTTLMGVDSLMVHELEKELWVAAGRLATKVDKRPSLRKAMTGTVGLSVACVTGSLAAGAGPLFASALGGASYIAGVVTRWLGNRPARGEQAFKRLIVQLFDEQVGKPEVH
jgi:hypothetical protein